MNVQKLVFELVKQPRLDNKILADLKRQWAKDSGMMLKNSQILASYRRLVAEGKIKPQKRLEALLRLKKVRSLSGIVPIAVLTKPFPCPGECVYCPTQEAIPKSYLADEPAVMRAQMADFDPYLQVKRRIKQLKDTGHSTEKIELIVMGGTFSALPRKYQVKFIKRCFEAANTRPAKTLKQAQKTNETAKNRIIGITLETRPDQITKKEIIRMRRLGATRVEIGVQSIFDDVLKRVKRGHGVRATIKATQLLKDAGFKVCYHLMPNLPGTNLKRDYQMFKAVFAKPEFKPDMIKIYPCVVLYQAKLYRWYQKQRFLPYSDEELIKFLLKIKKIIPAWVRINRLGRDIPIANIAAGNKLSNIRQVLQARLEKEKIRCQCIRCREVRGKVAVGGRLKLRTTKYDASQGKEYFLQFVDSKGNLYALLRLRIPHSPFIKALANVSIIRELHTYGEALPLTRRSIRASQHRGLGRQLIKKAEAISRSLGIKKIAAIAGIGAREYYRRLGYQLEGTYMVKYLGGSQ